MCEQLLKAASTGLWWSLEDRVFNVRQHVGLWGVVGRTQPAAIAVKLHAMSLSAFHGTLRSQLRSFKVQQSQEPCVPFVKDLS